MAEQMEIDPVQQSSRRKRRATDDDNEDEDNQEHEFEHFSKRLRAPRGHAVAIERPDSPFQVEALLNNLAFTRLYVTANYHNYNPQTSPVILCFLSHQDSDLHLYHALW